MDLCHRRFSMGGALGSTLGVSPPPKWSVASCPDHERIERNRPAIRRVLSSQILFSPVRRPWDSRRSTPALLTLSTLWHRGAGSRRHCGQTWVLQGPVGCPLCGKEVHHYRHNRARGRYQEILREGQERHRKLMPPFSVGRPAECKVKSRGWIVLIHHSTPLEPLSKGVRIKCNLLGGLHSL